MNLRITTCKWAAAALLLTSAAFAQTAETNNLAAPAMRLEYVQPQPRLADAPSATLHRPLRADEKFRIFMQEAVAGHTLLRSSAEARVDSFANIGASGDSELIRYRRRYAYAMAQRETTVFLEKFLLATLLKQDPRYHPLQQAAFGHRLSYAMSRVLITRRDDGGRTFNSSKVLATLMSEAAASTYRPDRHPFYYSRRSATDALSRAGVSLVTDAGVNILREFWPDVKRKLAFWRD